jgi:hypothetical protein
MKILFLDIDGVLNSDVYMATDAYRDECLAAGCKDHRGYEVVVKAHYTHIDPAAVQLLNQLIEKTGAKVVLSSTWRLRYTLEEMNDMLKSRGATFEVTDKTPAKMSWRLRGNEVKEYLDDLKECEDIVPEAFVILDDIDEFPKFRKQFIHTPEKTGLTEKHVERAIEILNKAGE